MIRDNVPTVLSIQVIRHIFPTFGYHEASRRLCRVALTARAASRFRFSPCPVTGDKHLLSMNRKEERLLTPALPSTEEGREKRARRRFRGSMREWFRGNLSPALSSLGRNRGRRGHRAGYRAQCTHKVRGSLSSQGCFKIPFLSPTLPPADGGEGAIPNLEAARSASPLRH